mmetsp:Transcript_43749/g.123632  ORF Transcript_43749/g.123632 Transcript_43749/m.123632 type:complete len:114 (+) Transcript_43749:1188-1529(+)
MRRRRGANRPRWQQHVRGPVSRGGAAPHHVVVISRQVVAGVKLSSSLAPRLQKLRLLDIVRNRRGGRGTRSGRTTHHSLSSRFSTRALRLFALLPLFPLKALDGDVVVVCAVS